MRKCKSGWHLDDGMGWKGFCSDCVLKNSHPTLRRMKRKINGLLLRTQGRGLVREELLSDMREKTERLSMRRRQRIEADYKQAAWLLKDDLVWSGDFDNIRWELLSLIEQHIKEEIYTVNLSKIVQKLISDENDLSI
jgi:hypothetical protein